MYKYYVSDVDILRRMMSTNATLQLLICMQVIYLYNFITRCLAIAERSRCMGR